MIEDEKLEKQIKSVDGSAKSILDKSKAQVDDIEEESEKLGNKIKLVLMLWFRDANITVFPIKAVEDYNYKSVIYNSDTKVLEVKTCDNQIFDFGTINLNDKLAIYTEIKNAILSRK
jgi:hypothetical protein